MSLAAPTEAQIEPSLFGDLREPIGGNSELPWRTWSLSPERYLVNFHAIPPVILGPDWSCESLIDENPPFHRFDVGVASSLLPTFPKLYFFGMSPADLVIAVRTPNGEVFCNDDQGPLGMLNPGVELRDAVPGSYQVWLTPYGPTSPGTGMTIGVATDDFPWMPRVGSLRLTEEGLEQAFGLKLTLGATHFVADLQPGCPGLIDPSRPDFAILSRPGDKGVLLGLKSGVPAVLVVEGSDSRIGCTQSTEENGANAAYIPLAETIDGVYRIWTGPLFLEDANAEATLIVYPLLSEEREDGSRSRDGALETDRRLVATGTGFIVSILGHVITNDHVTDGCVDPHFRLYGGLSEPLELVLSDPDLDLALLKGGPPADVAPLAWDPPNVGADVVVYGFPLIDELSSAGNVQIGIVSALTGPGDNPRLMQISAGLQPGNSGGPILDRTGSVIGVAWATSKDAESLRERGLVLKNVNFAIRQDVLMEFLRRGRVPIFSAYGAPDRKDVETIVENARRFTGMILCTL